MAKQKDYLHTQTTDSRLIHSRPSDGAATTLGAARLTRLLDILATIEVDILFSDHLEFIYYLTGFRGSIGPILLQRQPEPSI
jgi:hypothetical protein